MQLPRVIKAVLVIAWALWALASYAQHPKQPLKHVGVLIGQVPCPLKPDHLFVRRLLELGWIEGQNFIFDCASTIGRLDQLPAVARDLASRQPDVLMAGPFNFLIALKQETTTIPIVMLTGFEPARLGLVTNFAQPEGNVTGVAWFLGLACSLSKWNSLRSLFRV
jgi:putative ABC transport system substrate-binding protein